MRTSILQCVTLSNWDKSSVKQSLSTSPKRSRICKFKQRCDRRSTSLQIMMSLSMHIPKRTMWTVFRKLTKLCLKPGSIVRTLKGQSLRSKKITCFKRKPLKSTFCLSILDPTLQWNEISCSEKLSPRITSCLKGKSSLRSQLHPSRKNLCMRLL